MASLHWLSFTLCCMAWVFPRLIRTGFNFAGLSMLEIALPIVSITFTPCSLSFGESNILFPGAKVYDFPGPWADEKTSVYMQGKRACHFKGPRMTCDEYRQTAKARTTGPCAYTHREWLLSW